MSVSEQILEYLMDIKQDVGLLKKSSIDLNSKVCENVKNIEKNRVNQTNTDLMMSRWLGGISVLMVIINIAAYKFFG